MTKAEHPEVRRDDRRSRRTRRTLTDALVGLMQEKRYDTITVQDIIDRANIGRSTFYAHYADKENLLQTAMVDLISGLNGHLDMDSASRRIVPSLELLYHLRENQALYQALVRGRAVEALVKTMQTHLSRHVESRLSQCLPATTTPTVPLAVVARYVAGALLTLVQGWMDGEILESPEQLNDYFLQLIRPSVRATTGIAI